MALHEQFGIEVKILIIKYFEVSSECLGGKTPTKELLWVPASIGENYSNYMSTWLVRCE